MGTVGGLGQTVPSKRDNGKMENILVLENISSQMVTFWKDAI